jgi:hypothetical protein
LKARGTGKVIILEEEMYAVVRPKQAVYLGFQFIGKFEEEGRVLGISSCRHSSSVRAFANAPFYRCTSSLDMGRPHCGVKRNNEFTGWDGNLEYLVDENEK